MPTLVANIAVVAGYPNFLYLNCMETVEVNYDRKSGAGGIESIAVDQLVAVDIEPSKGMQLASADEGCNLAVLYRSLCLPFCRPSLQCYWRLKLYLIVVVLGYCWHLKQSSRVFVIQCY